MGTLVKFSNLNDTSNTVFRLIAREVLLLNVLTLLASGVSTSTLASWLPSESPPMPPYLKSNGDVLQSAGLFLYFSILPLSNDLILGIF